MVSKKNKTVSIKLSKVTYDFVKIYCSKYDVSISSFCQYCISKHILVIDQQAASKQNPTDVYKQIADFIKINYDLRRK